MLKEINLYTDGACSGNPGPGGYCAILSFSKKLCEPDKMYCPGVFRSSATT